MKILIVTSVAYPHLGGVSRHIEMLKKGLDAAKHRATIVSINNCWPEAIMLAPFALKKYVDISDAGLFVAKTKTKVLKNWVKRNREVLEKSDIVHTHDAIAYAAIRETMEELGLKKPVVLTVHGFLANEMAPKYFMSKKQRRIIEEIEEDAYAKASYVIAVEKTRLEKVIKFRDGNASVVHNWIDTDRFRPSEMEDNKDFVALVPRRLVKKNGVMYAVEAMEGVPKGIKMEISGEGPEKKEIWRYVKGKGLDNVCLVGTVSEKELERLYMSANLIIVPSISYGGDVEGLSMSILEALSCGKPVIATAVGGNGEVVKDGYNGIIVKEKNPEEIGNAMITLYKNREVTKKMGENARKFAVEKYSLEIGISKILNIYREVTKK